MTKISACTGCAAKPADCDFARNLLDHLRGLHVTLVRHQCPDRKPLYAAGDAVLVRTVAYQNIPKAGYHEDEDHSDPPMCEFIGVFVRQVGTKAVAFIKPGTEGIGPHDIKYEFETDGIGFVKVPLSRMKPDIGARPTDLKECRRCGELFALTGRCDKSGVNWINKIPCVADEAAALAAALGEAGRGREP